MFTQCKGLLRFVWWWWMLVQSRSHWNPNTIYCTGRICWQLSISDVIAYINMYCGSCCTIAIVTFEVWGDYETFLKLIILALNCKFEWMNPIMNGLFHRLKRRLVSWIFFRFLSLSFFTGLCIISWFLNLTKLSMWEVLAWLGWTLHVHIYHSWFIFLSFSSILIDTLLDL